MNPRTALLTALVALVLVLATWLATRSKPVVPPATQTHHPALAQCASAVSVGISGADGSSATLTLDSRTELWMLEQDGSRWPVEPAAMQGCLRLLADLSKLPAAGSADPAGGGGVSLLISVPGQRDLELRVPASGVAGRVGVMERVDGGWVRVDADARLVDLFQPRNLAAWRRTDLLSGAGTVVGVSVESGGRRLALRQNEGRWAMVHPVACPADQSAARQVASGAVVVAQRFLDSASAQRVESTFERPTAVISRTFRMPALTGGRSASELSVVLTCGQSADATQATFLARAEAIFARRGAETERAWGPVTCVVDRGAIEGFAKESEFYASSRSVQAPSMDVSRVMVFAPGEAARGSQTPMPPTGPGVGETLFTRTLDGWVIERGAETARASDEPTRERIEAAIRVLCDEPAARVSLRDVPEDARVLGALAVYGSRGLLEVLVVSEVGAGAGGRVAVRAGRVWRDYAGEHADAVRRIVREHLVPEG